MHRLSTAPLVPFANAPRSLRFEDAGETEAESAVETSQGCRETNGNKYDNNIIKFILSAAFTLNDSAVLP